MADECDTVAAAEMRSQALGQVHRPVLAAGAADGNGEIAAVGSHQRGQPACDEVTHVLEKPVHFGLLVQEPRHRLCH